MRRHGGHGVSLVPPHTRGSVSLLINATASVSLSLNLLHRHLSQGCLQLRAGRGCGQRQGVAAQVESESNIEANFEGGS